MIADVFCKIIAGEFGGAPVYGDDDVVVLKDIHPVAPVHLLVIPKKHYGSLADFAEGDALLLGKLFLTAHRMAKEAGLDQGYRLIVNTGEHGGQVVPHLHIHVIGGKKLGSKIVKD